VSIPRANQTHKIEQKVEKLEQKQKPKKKIKQTKIYEQDEDDD
jgi:hypothetical protein